MGRKYALVSIVFRGKQVDGVKAFIDTGADFTVISTRIAKKLGIKDLGISLTWRASDGDDRKSPLVEIHMKMEGDNEFFLLEDVLVDDSPLDPENKEQVILGLDYLQKSKKTLVFDD